MKATKNFEIVTILGPTATGKTALAASVALRLGSGVISADSRQVYKGMNIGTGKDYDDYSVSGVSVPYHLIDILDAGQEYNLFEYQKDFHKVFESYKSLGRIPVICGGTGLYIQATLQGYRLMSVPENPQLRAELEQKSDTELVKILSGLKKLHNTTDSDTRKRLIRAIEIETYQKQNHIPTFKPLRSVIFGIHFERPVLKERITQRLHKRLNEGMIDEVRELMNKGISAEKLAWYGLEYKFITNYLTGKTSYDEMVEKLNIAIHQFSKRQMTWFRKMEREGFEINWIDGRLAPDEKTDEVVRILKAINNSFAIKGFV